MPSGIPSQRHPAKAYQPRLPAHGGPLNTKHLFIRCRAALVPLTQYRTPGHSLVLANAPSPPWSLRPRSCTRSESALHLVSYEGVVAAGLDPFVVLLDRVMGLPPVDGYEREARVHEKSASRVVAATTFLIRFIRTRSDQPTWFRFRCVRPFAEEQLLPLLPMTCSLFANWTAALNARERAAVAAVAPGAHRWAWDARRCSGAVAWMAVA